MKHETLVMVGAKACPKLGKPLTITIILIVLAASAILRLILLGHSTSALLTHFGYSFASMEFCTAVCGYASLALVVTPYSALNYWFLFVSTIGLLITLKLVSLACIFHLIDNPIQWEFLFKPDLKMIPVAFGVIIFTYSMHILLPSVEGAMKAPHNYSHLIRITFTLATIVKVGVHK